MGDGTKLHDLHMSLNAISQFNLREDKVVAQIDSHSYKQVVVNVLPTERSAMAA